MMFGLDKYAVSDFVNVKVSGYNFGVTVGKKDTIHFLEPGQVKYLGVDESNGIQHITKPETLRCEQFRRMKMVLRTELYVRRHNKILAINGFALPVLTYGFWCHS